MAERYNLSALVDVSKPASAKSHIKPPPTLALLLFSKLFQIAVSSLKRGIVVGACLTALFALPFGSKEAVLDRVYGRYAILAGCGEEIWAIFSPPQSDPQLSLSFMTIILNGGGRGGNELMSMLRSKRIRFKKAPDGQGGQVLYTRKYGSLSSARKDLKQIHKLGFTSAYVFVP